MSGELRQTLEGLPTQELIAILRENDLEQWRPEVFPEVRAILRSRGVDVTFLARAEHVPAPVPGYESLAIADTFGDAMQANLCRMALQESEIEAWLSTEHLAGVHPPLGLAIGVSVLVRPRELPAAKQILEALARGDAELPEESEVCPRCGAIHTIREMPVANWVSRCPACGHTWE